MQRKRSPRGVGRSQYTLPHWLAVRSQVSHRRNHHHCGDACEMLAYVNIMKQFALERWRKAHRQPYKSVINTTSNKTISSENIPCFARRTTKRGARAQSHVTTYYPNAFVMVPRVTSVKIVQYGASAHVSLNVLVAADVLNTQLSIRAGGASAGTPLTSLPLPFPFTMQGHWIPGS
jgi:hypothetical protein